MIQWFPDIHPRGALYNENGYELLVWLEENEGKNMYAPKAIIIDDDPGVLACLRRILQGRGFNVLTYENPVHSPLFKDKECPCSLRDDGCPDLIISDFCMPMMNGVALLEFTMQKGCRCRHLALISGYGVEKEDMNRLASYGARYFLKPISNDFYSWLNEVSLDAAVHHAA